MPSAKNLEQKQAVVAQLNEKLGAAVAGVLVDYKGITVENDTKLRRELRAAGVDYAVVKNSLLRRACENTAYAELSSVLSGTTALALSTEDALVAAKVLSKYATDSKGAFKIKAGFVEGKILDAVEVDTLAKLPSREELIAKTLGGLNAPITGFVNVLNGNMRGLVVALNQIAERKTA